MLSQLCDTIRQIPKGVEFAVLTVLLHAERNFKNKHGILN